MTNLQRVRWGVLSTSNIGRAAVIPAIQQSTNGELVAIASRDPRRARDYAASLGVSRSYGSYEALLSSKDIDAVYIPLPNSLHRKWVIKAAEAKKHVLCEKPLAMNTVECAEMDNAARLNGVKLMEAFMYRFHPQTQKVADLVRSRAIGDLRLIHSALTVRITDPANIRFQVELGGGSLMDVGCYCVNITRTIAGQEPVEVQAFANCGSSGVDDQMVGSLRFSNGLLAQFDCSLILSRRDSYQLVGTEGTIDVPAAFVPGTSETTIRVKKGPSETWHHVEGVDEYRLMVEHFASCVLNGEPLRYAAAEAAANMRVIEALYRSARHGGKPERTPSS